MSERLPWRGGASHPCFIFVQLYQPHKGKHMISLTSREREVVLAVAAGLSNKDISQRLNLALGTVKAHLHSIYTKLGVKNRTALVMLALVSHAN